MDRMTPLDAAFLELEDDDPHASLHVASVAIFEGPTPSYDEVLRAVASKLPLIPRYRQKVRHVPFAIASPVWVDDPQFDLEYHVRETALPEPGGEPELRRLLGRLMSTRLDRERPLWETWVVDGLADGCWALVTKVHHCLVDGVAGIDLLTVLLDLSPNPPATSVVDTWVPRDEPSDVALVLDGVLATARQPLQAARQVVGLARHPLATAGRVAKVGHGLVMLGLGLRPTPSTSLLGRLGSPRNYAFARGDLDDVRAIRHAFGGTVNDVVLTVIAGGFRTLLESRGEDPSRHVVRSLVPVSVRTADARGRLDNRVSCMLADLPVEVADPVDRLRETMYRLVRVKLSGEATAGEGITALSGYLPFRPVNTGLHLAFRYFPQQFLTTVTTNVPGPQMPLYSGGRRLLELFPYVPIADRMRIGIAIFSYCGRLSFGVTADRASVPDIDVLTGGIEEAFGELLKRASEREA
jgi:diacylglycerol O-acyltransferase